MAITLLAVDLPVPEGDTVAAFWSSVREYDGLYAAFLIGFVVIAAAWGNHHDVARGDARRAAAGGDTHGPPVLCPDGRLRTIDSALLRHHERAFNSGIVLISARSLESAPGFRTIRQSIYDLAATPVTTGGKWRRVSI
jgi:Endosomal/lysosomal potassium channel TMEM175